MKEGECVVGRGRGRGRGSRGEVKERLWFELKELLDAFGTTVSRYHGNVKWCVMNEGLSWSGSADDLLPWNSP